MSKDFYAEAVEYVVEQQEASVSMIQRRFKKGYNLCAVTIEKMEREGVIGPSKLDYTPRDVLVAKEPTP